MVAHEIVKSTTPLTTTPPATPDTPVFWDNSGTLTLRDDTGTDFAIGGSGTPEHEVDILLAAPVTSNQVVGFDGSGQGIIATTSVNAHAITLEAGAAAATINTQVWGSIVNLDSRFWTNDGERIYVDGSGNLTTTDTGEKIGIGLSGSKMLFGKNHVQ